MNTSFTDIVVKELNERQNDSRFHPYTCCGDGISECFRNAATLKRSEGETVEYTNENEGVLIATTDGWVCPCGKYTQKWFN